MTFMEICKAYGEFHGLTTLTVMQRYLDGVISKYELLDGYLRNEGIIGYTQQIITAMRLLYKVE